MFGHGLRGLPHHHNFTTRSTSKSCSGMGPSIQVDREIQRPSIGQNHRHHHTDDGVTTVTVLPTLNHETQPDTNSKTVQAQHQNLEHRQTTVTGVGITYRAMLKASIPDCTMAPRSITPPQSTTLPPSASKAPIHGFTTNFFSNPKSLPTATPGQIPTAGNRILQSHHRSATTAVYMHRQHKTHYDNTRKHEKTANSNKSHHTR